MLIKCSLTFPCFVKVETSLTNPPAGTGTVLSGSKSAPLLTHYVPERTTGIAPGNPLETGNTR
jgi:hypothetical protein